MNTTIKQPNLLVVTSYPQEGNTHGKSTVGVASYAKNTLVSMMKSANAGKQPLKIRVLAELLGSDGNSYKENGIEVRRVWKRNSFQALVALLREITLAIEFTHVMIQFEVSMLGNPLYTLSLPILLAYLKILGKDVTIVQHQVIADFDAIAPHANIKKGSMQARIIQLLQTMLYRTFNLFANKVIVFDTYLKEQLKSFISSEKIAVIPHGVEKVRTRLSKKQARAKLGYRADEYVLLCFGYLAWYKGSDWISKIVSTLPKRLYGKKIRLVLAGGSNPNHAEKAYNTAYIEKIRAAIQASKIPIEVTGFVEEERIGTYFTACDATVYPYRYAMSASGPFAFTLTYAKPFMLSHAMEVVRHTPDMTRALETHEIDVRNVVFSLQKGSFLQTVRNLMQQKKLQLKLSDMCKDLGKERNFKYIGNAYYRELFILPYMPKTVLSWKQQNIDMQPATTT